MKFSDIAKANAILLAHDQPEFEIVAAEHDCIYIGNGNEDLHLPDWAFDALEELGLRWDGEGFEAFI